MLPPLEERPLVTFALFAYNQEKYIREAVEGAFAQTYEPLEIILSDDCSTDRTFEIMEEMAAGYRGPHRVRLRRSEINLGTALHFCAVGRMTNGELLIVAAGDDISLPARTQVIFEHWDRNSRPRCALHSGMRLFSEAGSEKIEKEVGPKSYDPQKVDLSEYLSKRTQYFWAPTCAYTLDLINDFPPMIGGSIIEDGVMNFRTLMTGSFISIDQILVRVRTGNTSGGMGYSITEPIRWNRFVHSKIVSLRTSSNDLRFLVKEGKIKYDKNHKIIESEFIKLYSSLSNFILPEIDEKPPFGRFLFAAKILFFPSNRDFRSRTYFLYNFFNLKQNFLFRNLRSLAITIENKFSR